MKSLSDLDYFTISIEHIITYKPIVSFLIFIDYVFALSRIAATINKNSFYSTLSPSFYFSFIYNADNFLLLLLLSLGILCLHFVFQIIEGFFCSKLPRCFLYFYVNFYEFILLRIGVIIFSDIHMTLITYLIKQNTLKHYILLIAIAVLLTIYYSLILRHLNVFYLFGYVTFDYPFDSFSRSIDSLVMVVKVISSLYFVIDEEKVCTSLPSLLASLLLFLSSMISLYSIYVMLNHSYDIMKNMLVNKLRIWIALFCATLGVIEWVFPINETHYFWVISLITIGLLILTGMLLYDEITFIPYLRKDNLINLLYFHCIEDAVKERKLMLVVSSKLQAHHEQCSNCQLCREYASAISKDKEKGVCFDTLIQFYKNLNKSCNDYFSLLLALIDKLSVQNSKITPQATNRNVDTSFNLRLKLFYFLRKQSNTNPTLLINITYMLNKHFGAAKVPKSEQQSNRLIEIELINDYISKFQIAFKSIADFLNSSLTVQTPKSISFISESIETLKEKKYKPILSNSNLQQQYYCLLLSIVYEQLLNTSLNKLSQIISEEMAYEDVLDTHYDNDRQITLKINLLTWELTIIQIGHELIEFLNKDLKEMFPPEFSKEEMLIVREKIDKEDTRMLLVIKKIANEKKGETIMTKESELVKQFTFLELRLFKFSHLTASSTVLAQGIYVINKNALVIIKNSIETAGVIYGINNHNAYLSVKKNVLMALRNEIILRQKPQVLFSLHLNMYQYDISYLDGLDVSKETTVLNQVLQSTVTHHNDSNNHWNFNCTLSMISSMNGSSSLMSTSKGSGVIMALRQSAQVKKNNKKWIERIFALLICFSIMMIAYSFVTMVFEINMVNNLKSNYDVFTAFRHINRQYYHTIASIVSISCLGHLQSSECVNYMEEYNKKLKAKYNNDIDLITLIHKENVLKLRDLQIRNAKVEQSVYTLNNPNTSRQFELEFEYYQISLQDNAMIIIASSISFREGMKRLINSMSYILNDGEYIKVPIYLITVKPIDFSNVYDQKSISNGQIEYYHIIINYGNFLVRWFSIYDALNKLINDDLFTLQRTVVLIMIGTLILHVILIGMISVLVNFYWSNAVDSLNAIQAGKLNKLFLSAFLKKVELLTEILLLYKENPNKIIRCLKDSYNQFTTKQSSNKKKTSPQAASLATSPVDASLYVFSKKDLWFLFSKYMICLISLTIYYVAFFIFFLLLWNQSIDDTYLSFNYINEHSRSEATAFSVFTLLQLMIYGNQTRTEISSLVHKEDPNYYVNELYKAFDFYSMMDSTQRQIKHLIHMLSDDFVLHCNDFYEKSNDNRFGLIIKESGGVLLPQLADLCNELFPSMNMNNELIVYKDLAKSVYNIIFRLNRFTYEEFEAFLKEDDLHYVELLVYLAFRPLRRLINELTYTKGIDNIRNRLTSILTSYALISALTDILSIVLLYFGFIMKLYKIEKRVRRLRKVFKITNCNKKL